MPLIGNPLGASVSVSELDSATLTTLASATAAGLALMDDANAAAQLTTLGVTAFAKTLLDDVDLAAAQATLGIGAGGTAAGVIVPSSGITAVTGYEISQSEGRLRLKKRTKFEDAEADAKTNKPVGTTLTNAANLTSAASASSILTLVHGSTGTRFDNSAGGTSTAPRYGRTVQRGRDAMWIVGFVKLDATAATNGFSVGFYAYESSANWATIRLAYDSTKPASVKMTGSKKTAGTDVNLASGSLTNGVWLAIRIDGLVADFWYAEQAFNGGVIPAASLWTLATRQETTFALTLSPLEIGWWAGTEGTAASFTSYIYSFDDQLGGTQPVMADELAAHGYAAAPAEQPLVVDFPVGASGVVSNANLRAWLASIVIEGTWTFSCVRGVGGHGSGAFAAAASATVEGGSGVALSIWAKATATANTQPAALDLRRGGMLWTV